MDWNIKKYYRILNLREDASLAEVEKAFSDAMTKLNSPPFDPQSTIKKIAETSEAHSKIISYLGSEKKQNTNYIRPISPIDPPKYEAQNVLENTYKEASEGIEAKLQKPESVNTNIVENRSKSEVVYCGQCGEQSKSEAKFCHKCGSSLDVSDNCISTNAITCTYAGFWIRFGAGMIDFIILLIPAYIVERIGIAFAEDFGGNLTVIIFWWLYYAIMESSEKQASIGKSALGLIVTDMQGGKISFWRASGRYFASFLSCVIVGIGYIIIGLTRKKQGLHDLMTETLVVKK